MKKEYKYTIGDNDYTVQILSISDNKAEVIVNGESYLVGINKSDDHVSQFNEPIHKALTTQKVEISTNTGVTKSLKAPLPGVIVSINVGIGQQVKEGQVVAVLEAMKMENEIQAECNGVVQSINVSPGESILEGTDIITIS